MTDATTAADPALDEFVIEEAWEFSAPMYCDFLSPLQDESDPDKWFDYKLEDDVSPEFDVEEIDMMEGGNDEAPSTPASSRSIYSLVSTPMTPKWRSQIEARSPSREDDLMSRLAAQKTLSPHKVKSPVSILPLQSESIHMPSTLLVKTGSNPTVADHIPQALQTAYSARLEGSTIEGDIIASAAASKIKRSTSIVSKLTAIQTVFTMPIPPTTLGTMGRPGQATNSRIPLQPSNTNRLNQIKTATSVANKKIDVNSQSRPPKASQKKTSTNLSSDTHTTVPVKRQPFASQRNVIEPIRAISNNATSRDLTKASRTPLNLTRSEPRFMAPTKSQLARAQATSVSKHTTVSKNLPVSPKRDYGEDGAITTSIHVSKPPHSQDIKSINSIREKTYERITQSFQQKIAVNSALAHVEKENAVNQARRQTPSLIPSAGEKSTPNTLRLMRQRASKPLTQAVTPELMKRRTRQRRELTHSEREASEAARARRAFWQEQHRKNVNRGLAPRIHYEPTIKAIPSVRVASHWR